MTTWMIPPSTSRWLVEISAQAPVAVLLRHSVRDSIPPDEVGYDVPLTEVGRKLARDLGTELGARLRSLHTSPLPRCVQSAESLRSGSGTDVPIIKDRLLGDPGVFVIDGRVAWTNWQRMGHEGVLDHLVSGSRPLDGMAAPDPAARFLVQHMLATVDGEPGVHIFVTHDSLLTATASRLLDEPFQRDHWPWYLEGAFFWRHGGRISAAYRDSHRKDISEPLCRLDDHDVVDFARREVSAVVGADCPARFFLAGGAFKSLLTGRPPRDLDFWAPTPSDRELLVQTLMDRGAHRLDDRPFADAFEIAERMVEVSVKADPDSLEERLGRFDIGLSAVGVEHRPGGPWRPVIHPLARASVERREVLLLKPLVNWKYALATLERLRRYADELGFVVPESEEAEVWRVFDSQPDDMKHGMLRRFERTAMDGHVVLEEVSCRLR